MYETEKKQHNLRLELQKSSSDSHLQYTFKNVTGFPIRAFLLTILKIICSLLIISQVSVNGIKKELLIRASLSLHKLETAILKDIYVYSEFQTFDFQTCKWRPVEYAACPQNT